MIPDHASDATPRWSPEPSVHDDRQLREFVSGLAPGRRVEYVGTLRRRTVRLHRFRLIGADPDEIVVKVFTTTMAAERAFGALERLAAVVGTGNFDLRSMPPLALARSVPALAMPYVAGPTLRDVLAQEPWRTASVMVRAGRVLAGLHQLSREASEGSAGAELTPRTRLASLGRTAEAATSSELVRRYVDFHPHNLLLAGEDSIVVIDPPLRDEVTHVHHDIVNFLYKAQKCLVVPPWDQARARYLLDLTDAAAGFLGAYFAAAERPISSADVVMLDRYLTLYATVRSRPSQWREDLPHQALFAPLLRQQLRRALRQVS